MVEIIGYIFIFIIAFLLLFEVIFKLIETFSQKISDDEDFDNERLKSFFPKNYHNYIDYYSSWNNAMFNYDFTNLDPQSLQKLAFSSISSLLQTTQIIFFLFLAAKVISDVTIPVGTAISP